LISAKFSESDRSGMSGDPLHGSVGGYAQPEGFDGFDRF
jgi:hypothetical protein